VSRYRDFHGNIRKSEGTGWNGLPNSVIPSLFARLARRAHPADS
jgi:hypothetical protein